MQHEEGDTGQPEKMSLSDRANVVARAEAAVWLALQDIGINDSIIVLNEILRETPSTSPVGEDSEPSNEEPVRHG